MADGDVGGDSSTHEFCDEFDHKISEQSHETDKVPLFTPWTFWVDRQIKNSSASEYEASLKKIYAVSTVQDFWSVFNNIPNVGELCDRYAYFLMRGDRRPVWEDECNRRGGAFKIKCYKEDTARIWKELLLAIIGEQFSDTVAEGDDVCGLSVCVRDKMDVVDIWHVESSLQDKFKSTIEQKVNELLPDVNFQATFYKKHPVE